MIKQNVEIVDKLPNGEFIIKIKQKINMNDNQSQKKVIIKYAVVNQYFKLKGILDLNGNLTAIQYFDNYELNELGDIIIGIKKSGEEYCSKILPYINEISLNCSFNYGLINRDGILVIYPSYDYFRFGKEDTCRVGKLCASKLKYGYVDIHTGNFITPVCFDMANDFFENRALVQYKSRFGYIDRFKIMTNPNNPDEYGKNLGPRFYNATDFKDGKAKVCTQPATLLTSPITNHIDTAGNIDYSSLSSPFIKKREKKNK